MSHPTPYVRIRHDRNDETEYSADVRLIVKKNDNPFFKSYEYGTLKSSLKEDNIIPFLNDGDLVIEHTYTDRSNDPKWRKHEIDDLGGWFNSRKGARFPIKLPAGKKILVMGHPDSSPRDKNHDGTIHFPTSG